MAGDSTRILIYSHDSFGLGHLRRCRAIASSLVRARPDLSVLILSGSPLIGSFEFPARVDFVRVPGVTKLPNGEYSSLTLHLAFDEVLALRESIIRHTAEAFRPDMLIVDKEPLGLRGEMSATLDRLRDRGAYLVLGLRDVLDEPSRLADEWARKNAVPTLRDYYDRIWVYGLGAICNPLAGISLPPGVAERMVYTGYLRREVTARGYSETAAEATAAAGRPYVLVTSGGGGDGEALFDQVLAAYEHDPDLPLSAVLLLGPFMPAAVRDALRARAAAIERVSGVLTFDPRVETLMEGAAGIVAMGGYNTFCEILSFDKPAVLVPRLEPRMEQFIRASRAQALGLVRMFNPGLPEPARRMAEALRSLPAQSRPSDAYMPGLLDGLENIDALVSEGLERGRPRSRRRPAPVVRAV